MWEDRKTQSRLKKHYCSIVFGIKTGSTLSFNVSCGGRDLYRKIQQKTRTGSLCSLNLEHCRCHHPTPSAGQLCLLLNRLNAPSLIRCVKLSRALPGSSLNLTRCSYARAARCTRDGSAAADSRIFPCGALTMILAWGVVRWISCGFSRFLPREAKTQVRGIVQTSQMQSLDAFLGL